MEVEFFKLSVLIPKVKNGLPYSHTLIKNPSKKKTAFLEGFLIRLLEKRQNSKKTFAWANPFFEFYLFRFRAFSIQKKLILPVLGGVFKHKKKSLFCLQLKYIRDDRNGAKNIRNFTFSNQYRFRYCKK